VVTFDWKTALDFNGQAAPYIQYAHVRATSILEKADSKWDSTEVQYELDPAEIALIENLSQFPEVVQKAAAELKPLHITNAAYELARSFNNFYRVCPVLNAESEVREFRLRIVKASRCVLSSALGLLGITAPDVM
jgi:arginyl-tRNA synthetase